MSEEVEEAIKLFDREDLLSDYGIQDTDTNIEVFLSVKDMIKYYKQGKEIERLNKIIKDIKSQLDYLETYSSKEDVFEDMKRRLDRIDKIIGSDKG